MPDGSEPSRRLDRLLGRAKLVIGFEKLWPSLVLVGVLAALFLAFSWLGLWLLLPGWARVLGVAAFGVAMSVALASASRARPGSTGEALARLDRDSGQRHRPVSASRDLIADPGADPLTRALWDLHQRRSAALAAKTRLAPPSPRLVERDRFALRGMVLVLLVAAAFVAGADKEGRLASAFAWGSPAPAGAGFRLDAWIDPPPYTGRPPLLLAGQPGAGTPDGAQPISAPANSTLVVRWAGQGDVNVTAEGGVEPIQPSGAGNHAAPPDAASGRDRANTERRHRLAGDGRLRVERDGNRQFALELHAIPDLPPTVTIIGKPKANLRGSLTLNYKIEDDYGAVGAEVAFSDPVLDGKPVTGRTLVEAPKVPLALPNGARGLGQGRTTVDLSAHPWAGAEASLVVSARDEGGNTGRSAATTVTLPARPFHKPLARALVEQRRKLVLDPDHHEPVGDALDALALAPDLFDTTPAIYLGLNAARTRLAGAKSDPDLIGVADLLWSMALTVEDGDLGQTERDLRALQRELRDALARGASPEEIKRLTEALKQQMEKFLAEMARKNGEAQNRDPADRDSKPVTEQQLQSMLDRMEQSARNGDMAEAQQLLDQLQDILDNLRSAQGDKSGQGSRQKRSMSALDRLMRDQQGLRDKTFNRGNKQRQSSRDRQNGSGQDQSGAEPGDDQDQGNAGSGDPQDNGDLRSQQQALSRSLEQLQKQMRELGLNGEQGFDEAQRAMKEAENALGQGEAGNDNAVQAQGRALQGLQKGARGLQGQMARGQGEGEGQQPGDTGIGRSDGTGDRNGTDPLGRERNDRNRTLDAQGGLDAGQGLAERARQVLEELRRRLGDRMRPQDEQDYLERLLKRY